MELELCETSTAAPTTESPRKKVLIAYLSATDNYKRRRNVREHCLSDALIEGIDYKFFVGRPSFITPDSHRSQGAPATPKEIEVAKALEEEQRIHGDIVVVPFRDMYRDLTDKVTNLMRYGVSQGYANIFKIDDDMCPNVSSVLHHANQSGPGLAYYTGDYLWHGDEYPQMAGPDGTVRPYYSGVCFMVSGDLARIIFEDEADHTLLFAPYGTDSDDANMGKWFAYAKDHDTNAEDFKMRSTHVHRLCSNAPEL